MVESHFTLKVTVNDADGQATEEPLEVGPDTRSFLMTDERFRHLRAKKEHGDDLVANLGGLSLSGADLDLRPLTAALLKPFGAVATYLRLYGASEGPEALAKAA